VSQEGIAHRAERDAYARSEAHPDVPPEPAYRYDRAVDRKSVLEFAGRDWARVAEAKATFWLNRKRGSSPAELLAMGDQLLRHAQSVRPDWPGEAERAADLAVHLRVAEALRAAGSRLR
jgi:hypothetical protein